MLMALDYAGGLLLFIIYLLGLVISVRAFLRCRKRAYLLIGAWFTLCVLPVMVYPFIMRPTERVKAPIELAEDNDELTSVTSENGGHGIVPYYLLAMTVINLLSPILLVSGLWLLARRETPLQKDSV